MTEEVAAHLAAAIEQASEHAIAVRVVRRRLTDTGLTVEAAIAAIHQAIEHGSIVLDNGFFLRLPTTEAGQ